MTLEADIAAMRNDAKRHGDIAEVLQQAHSSLSSINLADSAFSGLAFEPRQAYYSMLSHVESLLQGGQIEFTHAASTLNDIATMFERSDEAASAEFTGIWDPNR